MKRLLPAFPAWALLAAASLGLSVAPAPSLVGAWRLAQVNGAAPEDMTVCIFSEGYIMQARYRLKEKQFLHAEGGPYQLEGDSLRFLIDYDSQDSSQVGGCLSARVKSLGRDEAQLLRTQGGMARLETWERLDEGQAALAGDWRIRARMGEGGEMNEIKPSPRKTIKILSGTRFQWAAMNSETRQFFGTGGGTYSFEGGVYTERIEFFSRDSSRVGMSLSFSGSVQGDDWTHSGKSSRGQEIREIWRRE
jgi:hypothetical protein